MKLANDSEGDLTLNQGRDSEGTMTTMMVNEIGLATKLVAKAATDITIMVVTKKELWT